MNIHYFGIRHHGVGSTKRLLSALDRLRPTKVLIEGASDCTELLPLLAHAQMRPPVALLAYATELPECHLYYPFATFSPEYQACLWAINHGADLAFIDLPVAVSLALQMEQFNNAQTPTDDLPATHVADDTDELPNNLMANDPIGTMGRLMGFHDGESFWNDVIEQSGDDDKIFDVVHQMMTALRQSELDDSTADLDLTEQLREAYMRQEIRKHTKNMRDDECVVVVCGAWHIPALDERFTLYDRCDDKDKVITHTIKSDTAILKQLPKKLAPSKIKTTWIPWTSPRLAKQGYGAGVDAPMWYQHLWDNDDNISQIWLTKVATALRERGQVISTASVIEATRLAQSLSCVRNRRVVGFDELTDAVVACLCFGESLLWEQVADEILLGKDVGQIPDDLPLAPLLEDLERLKKQTKLKAEAIPKETDVDLRSQIGLAKSHLLHRLAILGVAWGKQRQTGSRGTFRERWELCWEPEFAVSLVENLVYGNTIFEASQNRLIEQIHQEAKISKLATHIHHALQAGLDTAAMMGIKRLSDQATHTDDVMTLLISLAPLIQLLRYGTARKVALDKVSELVYELTVKVCVGLPYAIKNINDEEAHEYHKHMTDTFGALRLIQDDELMGLWWQALYEIVAETTQTQTGHLCVVGLSARLLYQADKISQETLTTVLSKTLSPAIGAVQSARFFEGFFDNATDQLLYDKPLLDTLEGWILSLDDGEFTEYLPLFRRVFSSLDSHERKRLMDVIFGANHHDDVFVIHDKLHDIWTNHLDNLVALIQTPKVVG
ncbi:DUF5682 family protein [Moraxella sp. VT-16-12]|uniref:DUF5682 family protein n=1 Tax=Moraxella sp. VT-16-12 TaxID=2014877 RepID=UPI000B7E30B2|nr:DUF5682 family protein [Moraxella sp. VT-16-12]TWV83925.1 hypothetical protein CEW93_001985 [Moraxella sp. VT-16-12]